MDPEEVLALTVTEFKVQTVFCFLFLITPQTLKTFYVKDNKSRDRKIKKSSRIMSRDQKHWGGGLGNEIVLKYIFQLCIIAILVISE